MNRPQRPLSCSSPVAAALLAAVALTVTGCSFDANQSAQASGSSAISGLLHGGPNPVVGATVTLYATQNNGYGGTGLQLAQTTTNASGGFTFNPASYTCPAGQQAYITAAGGNTGANTANPNSLLMAAIGPCSGLSASTNIFISEATTVAAAYALSNFISITGSGASAVVGISAPANNNGGAALATSGACTGTGTAMTCYAAGLRHAFQNAANLASASNIGGFTTANPTGQSYSTPASNPTTAATAVALQNLVPNQLMNSLADSVEACVNSTGTTGATDTTSTCGTLFTNTTVPTTYTANTTFTTKPINTLQALVNLAKFPFMTPAAITNLYNLGSSVSFYQPSLTAAPPDFSIAILFRSYGTAAANQIGSVYYTTTDINDNVYATALTAPSTGSLTGAAPFTASSLSSSGVGNWAAPATISTSATNLCSVFAGTAATSAPCQAATDTAGHLYVGLGSLNTTFTEGGTPATDGGLFQLSTANGAVTPFTGTEASIGINPFALAVDRNNNVFYSTAANGASNMFEILSGAAASVTPTPVTTNGNAFAGGHLSDSIVFDTAGNIFAPIASGSNTGFNFFTNSGTLSSETFTTTANQCNCLGNLQGNNKWPTGGMVDALGNYWMTGQYGLFEIGNSTTNGTTAAVDAQAVTGGGSPGVSNVQLGSTTTTTLRISAMDGASTIFVPDSATSGAVSGSSANTSAGTPLLRIYYTTLGQQASITGCNTGGATGNTACITTNPGAPNNYLYFQALNPAIDATGSMWISSEGNDAVIQVIGTAAPTWPQVSYLHPSVMPQ